jgi:homoserine O-acetyltransferase
MANGIGNTESRFFTLPTSEAPFPLLCGASLPTFTLAYEIYGEMNEAKDNVILLFHALTGSQHAAGFCEAVPGLHVEWTPDCQQGWWDGFIGPGTALDTNRYCVVCVNYLGGCYGSTGPSSINPETGMPFGSAFPRIAVADIVDSQMKLLDHLGVRVLHATIGGSLGGMLCISLATRYPERVRNVIPIASGLVPSPLQRLHNFEQIYAIETDRHFQGGDYYEGQAPNDGLALARMISHKTFVSLETMERRARDEVKPPKSELFSWYLVRRSLESYMLHQGTKFVRRFDANSYLRVVDAWQHFNPLVEAAASDFTELFRPCSDQRYLIFTVDSDVCFYPDHQTTLDNTLKEAGVPSMRITVHSDKGHDSFLLEPELFTPHLAYMLHDGAAV